MKVNSKYVTKSERSIGSSEKNLILSSTCRTGKMNGSVTTVTNNTSGDVSSSGNQDSMALIMSINCNTPSAMVVIDTKKFTRASKGNYSSEISASWVVEIFSPESSTLLGVIT